MGGELEPPVETRHHVSLKLKEDSWPPKPKLARTTRKPVQQTGGNVEAYAYAPLAVIFSREEREEKVKAEEEANLARLDDFKVK